jgi:hypothetical protein
MGALMIPLRQVKISNPYPLYKEITTWKTHFVTSVAHNSLEIDFSLM